MVLFSFTPSSQNKKTGPIPVTVTDKSSCPSTCPLLNKGCYAKSAFYMHTHWKRVSTRGKELAALCARIAELPTGQLWRHNQAGDLPGKDLRIARRALDAIVRANRGRRGYTYTHKPVLGATRIARDNRAAIAHANANGFCINLSANTLQEADAYADLGIGPVVTIVPRGYGYTGKTPAGRRVVLCPAQDKGTKMTCAKCQICAKVDRTSVIAFVAHGAQAGHVERVVRGLEMAEQSVERVPRVAA